jgi:hypothetical protein
MFGRPGLDRFNRPNGNLTNGGRQNNMGFAPLQRAVKRPGGNGGMMRQQQPIQQRPMQQAPKQPMMQNSVPEYIKTAPSVAQMPQMPQIPQPMQQMPVTQQQIPNQMQPIREYQEPQALTNDVVPVAPKMPQYSMPTMPDKQPIMQDYMPFESNNNAFNNYNRMMQQQTLNNQLRGLGQISDAELRQRNGY